MAASGNGRRTSNGTRGGTKQTSRRNNTRTGARSGTRATASRTPARTGSGAPRRNTRTTRTSRSRAYRRRSRPIFTRLWFWVLACFIIIFVVLITKGCDTGEVEQEAPPTVNDTHATVNATADGTKVPTTAPTSGGAATSATGQSTRPTQGSTATTGTTAKRTQGTSASGSAGNQQGTSAPTGPVYYENHHVAAGTQLIGSDLPAGTVDIKVLSGAGSLATSDGTLSYPIFGEGYTTSLAGVKLVSGASITVSGNLTMKFSYITEPVIDRTPASLTSTVYTVSANNGDTVFTVGEMGDIEPGLYQITAISGSGQVFTSDAASGAGIDEMMGVTQNYLQTVKNVRLNEGVSLTVRGCTVKLTRMEENND